MERWRNELRRKGLSARAIDTVLADTYRTMKANRTPTARQQRRGLSARNHEQMVVNRYTKKGLTKENASGLYYNKMRAAASARPTGYVNRGNTRYYPRSTVTYGNGRRRAPTSVTWM